MARKGQLSRLLQWFDDARYQQHAHYEAASYYRYRNRMIGIPAVILGAIISTGLFVSASASAGVVPLLGVSWQVATGVVSALAAVLIALVNFLRYAPQAKQHHRGGNAYAAIRRAIEVLLDEPKRPVADDDMSLIKKRLDNA